MNTLVGIDDTDNIASRGTGELATLLAGAVARNGWGTPQPVTRHQMLVHPDIPYTSHNSAMCFAADIGEEALADLTAYASEFLARESAPGSDPGLCIVSIPRLREPDALIAFGRRAKQAVIPKAEAYRLAQRLQVHLSEHGGTGLGVIGALAGCGLRLTGNDGRFRGHFRVTAPGPHLSVAELKRQTGVDVVKSLAGDVLRGEETVVLGEKIKAVLQDGKSTLLVFSDRETVPAAACWRTCTKQQLRAF